MKYQSNHANRCIAAFDNFDVCTIALGIIVKARIYELLYDPFKISQPFFILYVWGPRHALSEMPYTTLYNLIYVLYKV